MCNSRGQSAVVAQQFHLLGNGLGAAVGPAQHRVHRPDRATARIARPPGSPWKAAEQAPAIEELLRSVAMAAPETRLIRHLAERPDHVRTFDNISGLNATLLAMATLHMGHYRDRYRDDLSARALAWLFYNMAVATTLRYIESDDPISLDELRRGLRFASTGLLAGGRG
ncbi:TetR/AcrR family transcriptional regulator [Mycobacterium sp. C31M]